VPHEEANTHADSRDTGGNNLGTGRPEQKRPRKRRLDRFPYVVLLKEYTTALATGNVLGPDSLDVRSRTLRHVFQVLLDLRDAGRIDTLDPRHFMKKEIDALSQWMADKSTGYQAKLWTAIESFLLYCENGILKVLETKMQWTRPDPTYTPQDVKDEDWLRDTLRRLDGLEGWQTTATRFVVAFMFGTGLRPKELRLADLKDLDANRWVFRVMHPKKVRGAIVGAELAIYADTRVHVADFLAAREKHLLELGINPASVTALIPSERGKHYSDVGFRNIRIDTFRKAGVTGDFRVLRRTHEQLLMDRLEQRGYKEGSVIEIAAKRLRHSPLTALKHYADLRTRRGQDAAKEAWEAPVVEVQ